MTKNELIAALKAANTEIESLKAMITELTAKLPKPALSESDKFGWLLEVLGAGDEDKQKYLALADGYTVEHKKGQYLKVSAHVDFYRTHPECRDFSHWLKSQKFKGSACTWEGNALYFRFGRS